MMAILMFKIDLIVWKSWESRLSTRQFTTFKIDLIVWKSGQTELKRILYCGLK